MVRPRYAAIFHVQENVLAHLAVPADGICTIELEDQMNGRVLKLPTSRTKWRFVTVLVIERLLECHLFAELELVS